jgi:hypothetical protein
MHVKRMIFGAVAGVMLGAGTARAQGSAASPFFVDGTVFVGIEERSRSEISGLDDLSTGENPSDRVLGGALSVGTFLGSRVSARLEIALLGETALHTEAVIGSIETSIVDRYIASQSYSVLAGYHPPSTARVRLAYLAGVAFVRLREEFIQQLSSEGFPPIIPPTVDVIRGKQVSYGPTVMVGLDGVLRLRGHLDLVPQIRMTAASGLSIRPGVALRWRR